MKKILYFVFNMSTCVAIASSFAINSSAGGKRKGGNGICKNGFCGTISYKYIRRNFKGLFHSADDISMFDLVNNDAVATPLVKASLSISDYNTFDDGAICCSTHVQHLYETEMVNVEGETLSVIHFPDDSEPTYQYIPYASCVQTGRCPGTCVVERKILSLLVWHAEDGTKFDSFEVPGYCSCKNIGSVKK